MKNLLIALLFVVCAGTKMYAAYMPSLNWGAISDAPDVISGSSTLDFPNTLAGTCSDLTMTVNGLVVGDCVALGISVSPMPANGGFVAWVSNTNEVTVRFINNALLTAYNPASATFKVKCIQTN